MDRVGNGDGMSVRIVTEADLRHCVGLDQGSLNAVAGAFIALAEGRAMMPPVMHLNVEGGVGDIDVKSAFISGDPEVTIKIGSGFFGNAARGLPSSSAMMAMFSAKTGFCEAVLLDNGYLTDLRTALAGALAAQHLAPKGPLVAGIIGTGAQAVWQLAALPLVCQLERALIFGRDADKAARTAARMGKELSLNVSVATSVSELAEQSDIIVTTTSARAPILTASMLRRGQHITAMGSDLPGKRELDPDVLYSADLFVCDDIAQSMRLGELQGFGDDARKRLRIATLGDVACGAVAGRAAGALTVCDLTGTGVQDSAISRLAFERAAAAGLGLLINTKGASA